MIDADRRLRWTHIADGVGDSPAIEEIMHELRSLR